MSEVAKGRVSKIGEKNGTSKKGKAYTLYSFQLEGDDRYFNCGFDAPGCNEGEIVKFTFEVEKYNGKDKCVVDIDSIEVLPAESKEAATVSAGLTEKDEYYRARDRIIQLQECRKIAASVLGVALEKGAITLPAKKKVDDQLDNLLSVMDKMTAHFLGDVGSFEGVGDAAAVVEAVAEDEAEDDAIDPNDFD